MANKINQFQVENVQNIGENLEMQIWKNRIQDFELLVKIK